MAQYYHDDKEFGRIYIMMRRNMRTVRFQWENDGHLHVHCPPIGASDLQRIIDYNRVGIRATIADAKSKPAFAYHVGQVIPCIGFDITIGTQDEDPQHIKYKLTSNNVQLRIPSLLDPASPQGVTWIASCIGNILQAKAHDPLLALLKREAARTGVQVNGFEIGHGKKKLGHCTSRGVILLSRNVALLTEELACYIICHELAHRTYLSHNADFHALVNKYTGGREAELEKSLKAYMRTSFPLPLG